MYIAEIKGKASILHSVVFRDAAHCLLALTRGLLETLNCSTLPASINGLIFYFLFRHPGSWVCSHQTGPIHSLTEALLLTYEGGSSHWRRQFIEGINYQRTKKQYISHEEYQYESLVVDRYWVWFLFLSCMVIA